MRPLLATLLILLGLAAPSRAQAQATAEPGRLCRAAIQAAERAANLPPHLLTAIARVESGRRDPETGDFHPWPWTINSEGRGQFFPTKAAVIAGVRAEQARGVRSIDIGCMQINLRHHPNAFANLEEAFDPVANARYAARFLTELNATRNDWPRAASAYHSQTPEFAEPYRARVMAAWAEEQRRPHAPVPLPNAAQLAARPGGGGFLANGSARAATIAAPLGTNGRSLDAYRSLPVPIAGRSGAGRLALLAAR